VKQLHEIDLNLLVVLRTLLREQHVSRTAYALNLSQPAVSGALVRLRKLFGDVLFERTLQGMQPTPFAREIAPQVEAALVALESTINFQQDFVPRAASRRFNIGMSDIGEIYFLPKLIQSLAVDAPGVTVSTIRNATVDLRSDLESGQVDMAVGFLPQLKAGFMQRRLFSQHYVCLIRSRASIARGEMTLSKMLTVPHAVVVSDETGHNTVDAVLQKSGVRRHIAVYVPHFVALPYILAENDLMAIVPAKFAQRCSERFDLIACPPPLALPAFQINLFWHKRFHADPGNAWLRNHLFETFHEQ
jgi:DNA-binding transcriptional LysR family regulator